MIPKEYEYFLCISLWFVFILRSLVSYILTTMSLKSQKKTFIYAWKVQNVKILWEYVPCITSSLEVMQCTPIGMASLVISRKWFPFRFCFVSSSEICMSRSYDFSLPLISFSIYSIDCIPDSISFLELWALDCKEFHEFGRFSLNMTTLLTRQHWACDLSGGELTVVFSYERWDNITSVQRNLESQTLAIFKLW